jgi:uncharacterized protein YqeY
MSLQEQITKDMRDAMLGDNKVKLSALRFVVGEFSHIPSHELANYPNKQLPDERVIKIVKKCIENELGVMPEANSIFIDTLKAYLPKEVPYMEIYEWAKKNVDFDNLPHQGQAVGIIKKHFGESANTKDVQEIVASLS